MYQRFVPAIRNQRIYRYDRSVARRAETIELAVLGLLHEGPMHGYELRKRLNLMLGWGRVLSYGSLYPTLKKMLRGALIEESTASTPLSRRPKIVYQVTEAGTREFERLMAEVGPTAWEDDNFDIRFAFFSSTDMEIRLRVLEGRRMRLQERLDRVQRELSMTEKEADRYAGELQRHGVESVEREVNWLSDLINAERSNPSTTPSTVVVPPTAETS
jgi:DNA-binding PadR family transcriptional regulator